VRAILRSLGILIGFAFVVLALAGPATAWDRHAIDHISSPMAVDAHHHHDDDGSVIATDDRASGSHHSSGDDDGDNDGGHDHMPSLLAALSDLPGKGPVLLARLSESIMMISIEAQEPPDLPTTPHIRPPRFV
jgi:hypothetical protein